MSRRRAASAALALPFVLLLLPAVSRAEDITNPLDDARRAAQSHPFTARVRVEWVDHRGPHAAWMDMHSDAGVMRSKGDGDRWSLLWPGTSTRTNHVPLASKYAVSHAPAAPVADRPTTEVVVREHGAVIERWAVDQATGLVLRRQMYDADGRRVRLVEVERIDLNPPEIEPASFASAKPDTPEIVHGVEAPFHAPIELAGEYVKVGSYRRGQTLHLLYSDGLHALSVFAQTGRLDRDELPDGGAVVQVGRRQGLHYAWPGGDVITWQSRGVVYTAVGDAPVADVAAAATSFPGARSLGVADRLRRSCRAVVETLTGV